MAQENEEEVLLTATEIRIVYKFTPRMMAMLKPAFTYKKFGQKYPVKLYYKKDVLALANSEEGKQLLAEAQERRERFWRSVTERIDRIRSERKNQNEGNDDLE